MLFELPFILQIFVKQLEDSQPIFFGLEINLHSGVNQIYVDSIEQGVILVTVIPLKIDLVEAEHHIFIDIDFASPIDDFEGVGVLSHWLGWVVFLCCAIHCSYGLAERIKNVSVPLFCFVTDISTPLFVMEWKQY